MSNSAPLHATDAPAEESPGWVPAYRRRLPLRRRLARSAGLLALVVAGAWLATRGNDTHRWLIVARDSNYTIAIDTAHLRRYAGRDYEIWYRTDHAAMRYYNQKAFNRELVHAILSCRSYAFRVDRSVMSVGDGRPVAVQTTDARDLSRQPWHRIEPGSTEADAAHATCVVADALYAGR